MIRRDDIETRFLLGDAMRMIEGRHPAPVLTLIMMLADAVYILVYAKTHLPGRDLFWQHLILFLLFPSVFPVVFDRLLRKHCRHQIMRNAWTYLDDSVWEVIGRAMEDCQELRAGIVVNPGYDSIGKIAKLHLGDLDVDLVAFPLAMRPVLREKLEELPLERIFSRESFDETERVPEIERIYMALHKRFVQWVCPDLSEMLIGWVVLNVGAMFWAW
ncbi:MAG: hypothetical protein AAGN35_16315 [Bacteroidota bacterium]